MSRDPGYYTEPKTRIVEAEYDPNVTIHELQKRHVLKALKHFDGNKTQAASALGITIKTLYNLLLEYGEFENYREKK